MTRKKIYEFNKLNYDGNILTKKKIENKKEYKKQSFSISRPSSKLPS